MSYFCFPYVFFPVFFSSLFEKNDLLAGFYSLYVPSCGFEIGASQRQLLNFYHGIAIVGPSCRIIVENLEVKLAQVVAVLGTDRGHVSLDIILDLFCDVLENVKGFQCFSRFIFPVIFVINNSKCLLHVIFADD